MSDRLSDLWDHVRDPYWRLDHPEVTALLIGVVSGVVGLLFAWLQSRLVPAAAPEAPA